jgi:hypothetical protein
MGAPVRGVESVVQGRIAGQHAGYQLGRQEQFKQLALSERAAEMRHAQAMRGYDQAGKSLGLKEARLGFEKQAFSRAMKAEEAALSHGFWRGLMGMGMAAYEGKRRADILAKDTIAKAADRREIQSLIGLTRWGPDTHEGSLDSARARRWR